MKNRILLFSLMLFAAIVATAQKTRVVENPAYESTNTPYLEFTRIESNKKQTVVQATIWYRHNYWVRILSTSMLKGCTTGNIYKLQRIEGIEPDKEVFVPESNRIDFKMYFEPVSNEDTAVDYLEGTSTGSWEIKGISLTPDENILAGSWEEVGNAGNVVLAFVKDRLLWDGEIWKYTTTKKGKNITLDITCGGVSRQLFAVQKGDGTILLKKSRKEKGILLTNKPQTVKDDAYAFDPKRATPLFFAPGKVVVKGCVTNNLAGSEQRNFMKILKQNNVITGKDESELVSINRNGTFQAEFEIDYPQYVYMLEPLNYMVFLTPGDTVALCVDAVQSLRKHYSGYAPAVLGNSLSAQLTRYSDACEMSVANKIEGLNKYCDYNKEFTKTQDAAYNFAEKAAPLFGTIYEQAPALLATYPLSPVAKDIIITNIIEKLFTNFFDVEMSYQNDALVKEGNHYVLPKSYVPLESGRFFAFLKEKSNFDNILNNNYLLCNNSNWVPFNRFAYSLFTKYHHHFLNNRREMLKNNDFIKACDEKPENKENKKYEDAIYYLAYGPLYTGSYYAEAVELAKGAGYDSLPSQNYIYRKTFEGLKKDFGIDNCMMLQQAIFETGIFNDRDLNDIVEAFACAMPFITNPVIAGQAVRYLRKLIAEKEGGASNKQTHPEVAKFLSSLNEKYSGEAVILDFWGIGCGPCRSSMLSQRELVEKYAGKVRFVYICDASNNPEQAVNEFFTTNNIKGENMRVGADVWALLSHHFNFTSIPHVEIMKKDGTMLDNADRIYINDNFIENKLLK